MGLPPQAPLPSAAQVFAANATAWAKQWHNGAALDLSGSTAGGAAELERRVVLSQYIMMSQEAGSNPPQESPGDRLDDQLVGNRVRISDIGVYGTEGSSSIGAEDDRRSIGAEGRRSTHEGASMETATEVDKLPPPAGPNMFISTRR